MAISPGASRRSGTRRPAAPADAEPAISTRARWAQSGTRLRLDALVRRAPRASPKATPCRRRMRAPKETSSPSTSGKASQGMPRHGRGDDQELAHEDAQRRQARRWPRTPIRKPQPSAGWLAVSPRISPMRCGALDLGDMADGEEDAGFGQAVHGHVQQPGEIGQRPAHAEGEGDDAHMLDRGIGEEPFDVAPPVEHEGGQQQRGEPHGDHHADRARARRHWRPAAS